MANNNEGKITAKQNLSVWMTAKRMTAKRITINDSKANDDEANDTPSFHYGRAGSKANDN